MSPSAVAKADKCSSSERREAARRTIQRREACRKAAAKIVEQMLQDDVSHEWFLDACRSLSQQDYEDAVEERAIVLQCGYPICKNKISRVPPQKYHICAKTNRVFDITSRKRYCSDSCYHASVFLKKQLYEGPLWLRDETEAPAKYELLEKEKHRGSHGEEVDFGWRRLSKEEVEILNKSEKSKEYLKPDAAKVSPYMTEGAIQKLAARVECLSVSEAADTSSSARKLAAGHTQPRQEDKPSKSETPKAEPSTSPRVLPEQKPELSTSSVHHSKSPTGLCETSNSGSFNSWMKALESEHQKIMPQSSQAQPELSPLENAEKTLHNWITIETLTLLLGKKAVDRMKASNPSLGMSCEAERRADHFRTLYARICRKLDREEAEEEQYFSKVLDSDDDDDDSKVQAVPTATVPSMTELKRDADQAQLRVYGFYAGQLDTADDETGAEESGGEKKNTTKKTAKKVEKKKLKSKVPEIPRDVKDPILPVVDSHAQNLLRCRILLDRIQKVLPDILDLIDVELAQVSSDLRDLVSSFRLTAENVIFKMQACKVIALCLVLMLSKQNEALQTALQDRRQRSLLEPFLDDIGITLTDAEHLVERLLSFPNIP
ncbi:putative RNA polymerase II subunit B1 CTD phosphatase RPAP2 isoform X2 [Ornithodoros turicata]|uniref:putative RNA polymerase II subunit B1 CTD phosphatase RPAP2 isoform X2 n=1 Tax=Ornithodoros turicata TaxID=34597 RepID=UPI003138CF3F